MNNWSKIKAIAIDYIGDAYCTVPYLYSNLISSNDNDPNIHIWIEYDENKEILCVCLLYHTCLHFFSRKSNYDGVLFWELLEANRVTIVMIPENNQNLLVNFSDYKWHFVTDFIFKHPKDATNSIYKELELNNEDEIIDVARLLISDPLYSDIYSLHQLTNQLTERWKAGFGKIFRIKKDGKIVGCAAITGECDRFLFNGCVMVASKYRRQGLFKLLIDAIKSYSNETGKECLYFVGIENSSSLAAHSKYERPIELGKIIKCISIK